MPPPLLIDPADLDLTNLVADVAEIERVNPQRHEFRLLDGIVLFDHERCMTAGYHDVRTDAFWVRGHIPGRPLFPGVLQIEAAAQLASFLYARVLKSDRFLGFTAVNGVKFRGAVEPPCRFVVVGRGRQVRTRRVVCDVQGFVGSTLVFEGEMTGMPI